jgi:hypothetical protein
MPVTRCDFEHNVSPGIHGIEYSDLKLMWVISSPVYDLMPPPTFLHFHEILFNGAYHCQLLNGMCLAMSMSSTSIVCNHDLMTLMSGTISQYPIYIMMTLQHCFIRGTSHCASIHCSFCSEAKSDGPCQPPVNPLEENQHRQPPVNKSISRKAAPPKIHDGLIARWTSWVLYLGL